MPHDALPSRPPREAQDNAASSQDPQKRRDVAVFSNVGGVSRGERRLEKNVAAKKRRLEAAASRFHGAVARTQDRRASSSVSEADGCPRN